MEPLLGKTLEQLTTIALAMGAQKFVGKQLAEWLYKKRATSFDQMTNIPKTLRQTLATQYTIGRTTPQKEVISIDGTKKYLFKVEKGLIETVYIPDNSRATICISTQVGCKMACAFCMTGKQHFSGNLSAAEILNQIFSIPDAQTLTNIVVMGMGEPFDNIDALFQALTVLTSEWGCAWSPYRITVSTAGVLPGIQRFINETNCHLAISLHNIFPNERTTLMPIEKIYPLPQIIDLLTQHPFHTQRRLSFEYILLQGINDSIRHAREIIRLLKPLNCRVNLIRFHNIPGVPFHSPDIKTMETFRDYLSNNGIICTIRRSRGEDISAACGLLSTKQASTDSTTTK